jgi:hypothetical protein
MMSVTKLWLALNHAYNEKSSLQQAEFDIWSKIYIGMAQLCKDVAQIATDILEVCKEAR